MAEPLDELVFAPLGGVGEIGMNLALYGVGPERARKWLAVDLGVAFAGDDLPGIDLIMPDVRFLIEAEGTAPLVMAIGIGVNCRHHPAATEFPATDLAGAGAEVSAAGLGDGHPARPALHGRRVRRRVRVHVALDP